MQLHYYETKEQATREAATGLNKLLAENKDSAVLFLVSGGSALGILDHIDVSNLNEKITIGVLNERFSLDKKINNFLQLQASKFFAAAANAGCNFIGTEPRPGELIEDLTSRWQLSLKNWQAENPDGKIFATFGLGPDGHTAGILPYPENLEFFSKNFENQHLITGYSATGKNPYPERVTTTLAFFKLIDEAIMFVCGEEKRAILERLIKGKEQVHQLPALGIYETKNFHVFTDIKI